jgi:hypothetical protein
MEQSINHGTKPLQAEWEQGHENAVPRRSHRLGRLTRPLPLDLWLDSAFPPQSGNVMPVRLRVWGTGHLRRWLSRSVSWAVAKARQLSAPP